MTTMSFREARFLISYVVLLGFVTNLVQSETVCDMGTYRSAAMYEQCVDCPENCTEQDHQDVIACEKACDKKQHTTPPSVQPHDITSTASQASQPSYRGKTRITDKMSADVSKIPTAKTAEQLTNNNNNNNNNTLAIVFGVLASVAVIAVTVLVVLRWRYSRRGQRSKTESRYEEPVTIIVSPDESNQQPQAFSTAEIVEVSETNARSDDDAKYSKYSSVMDLKETCI